MSAPCPPEAPVYFITTLHIIALISAPINILGLYLVLYKSPAISKYKYCIFYVQASSFLTEIQMSVVAPGYYFFPILGGFHTNDLVAKFIKNNHVMMTTWLFFLANELPAIGWCFVYRHNAAENMNRNHNHSRIVKKSVIMACQAFPFIVAICFYNSDITREEAKVYLEKNYPQCLYWLDSSKVAIYDWNTNRLIAITGIGALIFVLIATSYGINLAFQTILLLHKLRSHMSPQTYKMHISALISLSLQVVIPSVFLILPLLIIFWVIALDQVEHQELAMNSTVLICFHSVSSTVVIITANQRYRQIVGEYLRRVLRFQSEGSLEDCVVSGILSKEQQQWSQVPFPLEKLALCDVILSCYQCSYQPTKHQHQQLLLQPVHSGLSGVSQRIDSCGFPVPTEH